MANNNEERSYWPHMILGFLGIGIMLGYWTIKSAIAMPVNESNTFQMEYQQADMNINSIIESQKEFDSKYRIEPIGFKESDFKPNEFLKRKHGKVIALSKDNTLKYSLQTLSGTAVNDANVSFWLTRPHTVVDDQHFEQINPNNGIYEVPTFNLAKAGRYTLLLKVRKDDTVGFLEQEAYLSPN
ncbi:MAG: hypothetical protein HF962_10115 [Sulfurovum sp.]|nr:hypothetical protein [Sulfurovum sp.]